MVTRTGLQAFIKGVRKLCKIYNVWFPRMADAINNTPGVTEAQKTGAIAALTAVNEACMALDAFYVFFE